MFHIEVCPFSYFRWCGYFWVLWCHLLQQMSSKWGSQKIASSNGVSWVLQPFLTYFDSWQGHIIKRTKARQLWIILSNLVLPISRSPFEFCWMWIFPWVKLSWHSYSIWDKLGWLNWFLCEGLSSFDPKELSYSYGWSCSLCEERTSFCTEHL